MIGLGVTSFTGDGAHRIPGAPRASGQRLTLRRFHKAILRPSCRALVLICRFVAGVDETPLRTIPLARCYTTKSRW